GGCYISRNLADFDIPTSNKELHKIINIVRIMLQVKKLLGLTIQRFGALKKKTTNDRFESGNIIINNKLKEFKSPPPSPKKKENLHNKS
ncbi:5951_t:CDS:2, partial [Entrophospora sp. SA101]